MPIAHNAMAIRTPKAALIKSCRRKNLLKRVAASLSVVVARCKSEEPMQPDEPVAQILALEQHEHDEEEHDAGGRKRRQQRAGDSLEKLEGCRLRLADLDLEWVDRLGVLASASTSGAGGASP